MEQGVRIDKWLWAVRAFRTRSLASEACRSGKVKVNDLPVKPSHELREGEIITLSQPPMVRTFRVLTLSGNRVSAKFVGTLMEDLTPQSEYDKLKHAREAGFEFRPRGLGRPTKRERREIEFLKYYFDE